MPGARAHEIWGSQYRDSEAVRFEKQLCPPPTSQLLWGQGSEVRGQGLHGTRPWTSGLHCVAGAWRKEGEEGKTGWGRMGRGKGELGGQGQLPPAPSEVLALPALK